jgi:signal transduction histidine kinase
VKKASGALACLAALAVGLVAESVAFDWQDGRDWIPDLAAGLAVTGCGLAAWLVRGEAPAGALLVATGGAWFAGSVEASLLYLHRGPLIHLLVTYPSWRPRGRVATLAVVTGYASALSTDVWASDEIAVALSLALVLVLAFAHRETPGRRRRERLPSLQAGGLFALVLAAGALARQLGSDSGVNDAVLLVYQLTVVAAAVRLTHPLFSGVSSLVTDLVVELGDAEAGTVRDRLARTLGDPALEVGYWSPSSGGYTDERGRLLALPREPEERSATFVRRDGLPFAVLVHGPDVLADPALAEAVAAATRLTASHAVLRAEVLAQAIELAASGRRLLLAGDEERRRLEARLHEGIERRLDGLARELDGLDGAEGARAHLAAGLEDLRVLAGGLHPRALVDKGLAAALADVATRCPVPVDLDVIDHELPEELAAAVYFVCAEALTNVAKYAAAERVRVAVSASAATLTVAVADDGVGGADADRGSGLQGLRDRVAALGGDLIVDSPPGMGTRLAARIPLGGEARSRLIAS